MALSPTWKLMSSSQRDIEITMILFFFFTSLPAKYPNHCHFSPELAISHFSSYSISNCFMQRESDHITSFLKISQLLHIAIKEKSDSTPCGHKPKMIWHLPLSPTVLFLLLSILWHINPHYHHLQILQILSKSSSIRITCGSVYSFKILLFSLVLVICSVSWCGTFSLKMATNNSSPPYVHMPLGSSRTGACFSSAWMTTWHCVSSGPSL